MINQLFVQLDPNAALNQGNGKLSIKPVAKEPYCANYVKIDFDDSYSLEIKQNTSDETEIVLTAGGIHRVMDLQTLQHLVAMTY
ncbi:MAG TPA: hypothetical protein DIT32_07040 [Peptococcaceae bacterium]|nr:hypothetical protein [Peptococcaceae bacterium]